MQNVVRLRVINGIGHAAMLPQMETVADVMTKKDLCIVNPDTSLDDGEGDARAWLVVVGLPCAPLESCRPVRPCTPHSAMSPADANAAHEVQSCLWCQVLS